MELLPSHTLLLQILMALPDVVGCHVGVQVVDVMVLNAVGQPLQRSAEEHECAALQGCPGVAPF